MKRKNNLVNVGIMGCGAIGSGIAKRFRKDFKNLCNLSALYDINPQKALALTKAAKLDEKLVKKNLSQFLKSCDIVLEAINSKNTRQILEKIIEAKKSVIVMSVGQILNAKKLFALAQKNKCKVIIPSGAIAGIDAVKAAHVLGIEKITLTTRKPIAGFKNNAYIEAKKINLAKIRRETSIFKGKVEEAIKHFPQNINVAATLALACNDKTKLLINILTSPKFKRNSHEIEITGKFGKITTRTDNQISPDNPKTSYLAILSGIQALKNYCGGILVGT